MNLKDLEGLEITATFKLEKEKEGYKINLSINQIKSSNQYQEEQQLGEAAAEIIEEFKRSFEAGIVEKALERIKQHKGTLNFKGLKSYLEKAIKSVIEEEAESQQPAERVSSGYNKECNFEELQRKLLGWEE